MIVEICRFHWYTCVYYGLYGVLYLVKRSTGNDHKIAWSVAIVWIKYHKLRNACHRPITRARNIDSVLNDISWYLRLRDLLVCDTRKFWWCQICDTRKQNPGENTDSVSHQPGLVRNCTSTSAKISQEVLLLLVLLLLVLALAAAVLHRAEKAKPE